MSTLYPIRFNAAPLSGSPLPISLGLIKTHCALDGNEFDELLPIYLLAAISDFENITHRTIFRRPHTWVLEDFPRDGSAIRLPRGKTQAVTKISYVAGMQTVDLKGPSSTPPGADYLEDLSSDEGGVLMPVNGWPAVNIVHPAPVTIHFDAGWEAGEVPADIVEALLFRVRVSLDNKRGGVDPRALEADRRTFESMASAYRLVRWY